MTSEKKSISEDHTDYANLAFNPYAISTDDLTFSTFGASEPTKNGSPMENGGFIEDNPHYEDTLEVAKKAGLNGMGRRKKENVVYEAAGYNTKSKSVKRPEPPALRVSNIPPRPAEDWSGISKSTNTRWKLPFLILCLLVVVCLAGAALGVLAYFDDEKCSCNAPQTQRLTEESNSSRIVDVENEFTKNIREIFGKLDMLTAALDALERKQLAHKEEFTQRKASVDTIHQELNSAIQAINSTFNNKFKNVNSNVSSLSRDLDEVNTELMSVNNFSQQLSNTVENINSTFTTKIRNVSKQMGPRGFNGSQGLQGLQGIQGLQGTQGPQGVGNLSACEVHQSMNQQVINSDAGIANVQNVQVSYQQRQGYKVVSAVCSTMEHAGTIHAVLSRDGDKYTCTCAGPSTYSTFIPAVETDGKLMKCVIIYWECPELT